jgi:hypothetical protein
MTTVYYGGKRIQPNWLQNGTRSVQVKWERRKRNKRARNKFLKRLYWVATPSINIPVLDINTDIPSQDQIRGILAKEAEAALRACNETACNPESPKTGLFSDDN